MKTENLLKKAKQVLSIVDSSTLKDDEINMLINAAQNELTRCGIDITANYDYENNSFDPLIKMAILFFVKSHFGNVTLKEKEYAQRTFESLEESLSLSETYKIGVIIND